MIGVDPRPGEEHIRRAKKMHAVMYPALREIAYRYGYALATHGSLERDIDLIAVPWRDGAPSPESLIRSFYAAIEAVLGFATWAGGWTEKETFAPPIGSLPNPNRKPHGRLGWSIIVGGGPYFDISVIPPTPPETPKPARSRAKKR